MVKVTIDGNDLEVAAGTLILEAAESQGISIPTFCYLKRLAPLASCRMCLIEVEGFPKLQPACATPVANGMVVRTDNPRVAKTRESMLELLLANHPLDCPICDKGGECELQDTVVAYGAEETRFRDRKRVFRSKDLLLNSVIIFNANRCIQCQRCVRVCEEVVGAVALGTIEKGMDTEVTGFENSLAGCDHCGNCIEVCPVGALMSNPYRYKSRPWDLVEVDTVCAYCGTGCQFTVGTRDGRLSRVRSKYERGVNGEMLCVKGRFGFDVIDGKDRIRRPMIRKRGELVAVSWNEAVGYLGNRLEKVVEKGSGRIGGLVSPRLTNETLYLFQKLMRTAFRSNNVDSSSRWSGATPSDQALPRVIEGLYSRRALHEVLEADCLLVVGANVTDDNPVTDYLVRGAVRNTGNKFFMVSARPSRLDAEAAAFLRLLPGGEAFLFSALARGLNADKARRKILRAGFPDLKTRGNEMTKSVAPPATWGDFLNTAIAALANAESVTVLIGGDPFRAGETEAALGWLRTLARILKALGKEVWVQFLFDRPNQLGAWELGALPAMLPGWRAIGDNKNRAVFEREWGTPPATKPGADFGRMLSLCKAGKMDALYVVGSDPVLSTPDGGLIDAALAKLGFLIVQDSHLSETAARADVVLPAAAHGEESGTFTNNEGRVQKVSAIRRPAFEAIPHGEIFARLADALGHALGSCAPEAVFAEIARLVPAYRGIDLDDFGHEGALTAAPRHSAEGDLEMPPVPAPRKSAGLELVTGDCLFHSGYLSRHSNNLDRLAAQAYVEMSPRFAGNLNLVDGDLVVVKSRHGNAKARLRINKHFPDGVVFMPENFPEPRLNRLLKQGEYPCPVEVAKARQARDGKKSAGGATRQSHAPESAEITSPA